MKKNLALLAAALALAGLALAPVKAHSTVVTTPRITGVPMLPHFPIPSIGTKREILLPSPLTKRNATPTLQVSSVKLVIGVPLNNRIGEQVAVRILPSVPVLFPGKHSGLSIKKFGALFDGAKKEEAAPAVVVPQTDKVVVPETIEEVITKGRSYTLPERTLEDEIGI